MSSLMICFIIIMPNTEHAVLKEELTFLYGENTLTRNTLSLVFKTQAMLPRATVTFVLMVKLN